MNRSSASAELPDGHGCSGMLATQKGALRGVALPSPCRHTARSPAAARARTVRVAARKLDKRSIKKVRGYRGRSLLIAGRRGSVLPNIL